MERLKLPNFETSGEVDCKFLNFGVNIEKVLKLHGLKMHFPLKHNINLSKHLLMYSKYSGKWSTKATKICPNNPSTTIIERALNIIILILALILI
jgi:hypothetical protein